ncbi:hypothetical protein CsSME_00009064 [Camellia sinensis var. sinensis]
MERNLCSHFLLQDLFQDFSQDANLPSPLVAGIIFPLNIPK